MHHTNTKEKPLMTRGIYAIYDNVAKSIIGMLHMHSHEAAAVRMFVDVANMDKSMIATHPQDFDLVCLGEVCDNLAEIKGHDAGTGPIIIADNPRTVLTGAAWAAAQAPQLVREATNA